MMTHMDDVVEMEGGSAQYRHVVQQQRRLGEELNREEVVRRVTLLRQLQRPPVTIGGDRIRVHT